MAHSRHTMFDRNANSLDNLGIAPSFNGRTADSGSAYRGSNPWGAANLESTAYDLRIPPKQPAGEQKSVTFVSGTRRNRDDSAGEGTHYRDSASKYLWDGATPDSS